MKLNNQKPLTELEKLQLRKIRLKAEADKYVHALDGHFDYFQENAGGMMMNAAMSTLQTRVPSYLQFLFPASGKENAKPQVQAESKPADPLQSLGLNAGIIIDQVLELLPLFVKGKKTYFISLLLKGIRKVFFK